MTGTAWADNLPVAQGLYDPELEKDSCGVGFIVSINVRIFIFYLFILS
jgi:glutamate synthase (NADPH/NADH)